MNGLGTDEDTIKEVLSGRKKSEIAQIKRDYQARYGRALESDLKSDLSGRELFDAKQDLKGKPQSLEEALQRMNERHTYERSNGVSNAIMDTLSSKGTLLDRNHERANAAYQKAKADGGIDVSEAARLQDLTGYADADVKTYQGAKDSAADGVGTVVATAASVAVVIGTAGTATPLVATAFAAAGAGAATRTLVAGAIQGNGFGVEQALTQAGYGAVDGVATAVGMRAGVAVAQGVLRSGAAQSLRAAGRPVTDRAVAFAGRNLLANNMCARVALGALEGSVDGAIGGGLGAAGITAAQDNTWDGGFTDGLSKVAQSGAMGVGLGAAGGALGSGLASRNSTRLADDMIARLPAHRSGGRAGVDEWGFDAARRQTAEELSEARRVGDSRRAARLQRELTQLENPAALRRSMLQAKDAGRVQRELAKHGVDADREVIEAVKRYNFDSAGIGFYHDNYAAWSRLAQGKGTLADAQYLVHEIAEVQALRKVQQRTGFDFMGKGYEKMGERQARQWQKNFQREYMSAHRKALEAEYDFVARKLLPYLERCVEDRTVCLLMLPPSYGELRDLAALALAAERQAQGLNASLTLEAVPYPLSITKIDALEAQHGRSAQSGDPKLRYAALLERGVVPVRDIKL